jgi:ABC-type oligopeptide transport system ATPase subunit
MFNTQAKDLSACRTLANATVITYKSELHQVDKVEQYIASRISPDTKLVISVISALQNGNVYVPLINKEF